VIDAVDKVRNGSQPAISPAITVFSV